MDNRDPTLCEDFWSEKSICESIVNCDRKFFDWSDCFTLVRRSLRVTRVNTERIALTACKNSDNFLRFCYKITFRSDILVIFRFIG